MAGKKKTTKATPKKATAKPARSALDRARASLLALDEVAPPPIPVDRLVAEAKLLSRAATKRLAALTKVGLDAKLVAALDDRAAALADAQAELTLRRAAQRSKDEIAAEREAVALRSQMVADGRYALRDDAEAQAVLDVIQEGDGVDDLVQDLRALAAFAGAHKAALGKVGVKAAANAKAATQLAARLEKLVVARRGGDDDASRGARDLRDRAATHLAHAMSEIRAAGVYAFRNDAAAVQAFRSGYNAAKRARAGSRARAGASGTTGGDAKSNGTAVSEADAG